MTLSINCSDCGIILQSLARKRRCSDCKDSRKFQQEKRDPLITIKTKAKNLKYNYNITLERYDKMLYIQESKCAICNNLMEKPFVDHCHTSGNVRELLCHHCNSGIGFFKDDPSILLNAVLYLMKHKNSLL